ncbi:response regulator [Mobilicoccus pelagius]|uniref:Putative two-component response regulator n=1 Tax=Mobilicoccus pelagius NBRC 104925 TaxID=1089455 RepID=H5URW6_9MICO|nr:response regulator transcription factor [Mobilicoccus pelagius]GAB48474.1 putative two-component response regulator [Mobilicoccus pelagius NBRC 104925]
MTSEKTSEPEDGEVAGAVVRVVVVDDHVLYRRGLEMVLGTEDDLRIVGEAADGVAAVEVVAGTRPDVVLMDVRMPGGDGIEACRRIRDLGLDARVVMITTSEDERDLVEALRAGAKGYLLKDAPAEQIIDGIRAVHAGESLLSPALTSALLEEFSALVGAEERRDPRTMLTEREREVLAVLGEGLTNKEIAGRLFISENTVKNHVHNLLEKLGLHSRTEAALFAVRQGRRAP